MDPIRHSTTDERSPPPFTSAWALVATVAAAEAIGFSAIWTHSPTTGTALLLLALGLPWLAAMVCVGRTVLPRPLTTVPATPSASAQSRRDRQRGARSWRLAVEIVVALALIPVGLFAQSTDAADEHAPSAADRVRAESAGETSRSAPSQTTIFQFTTTTGRSR